jgi:hypothetical protein
MHPLQEQAEKWTHQQQQSSGQADAMMALAAASIGEKSVLLAGIDVNGPSQALQRSWGMPNERSMNGEDAVGVVHDVTGAQSQTLSDGCSRGSYRVLSVQIARCSIWQFRRIVLLFLQMLADLFLSQPGSKNKVLYSIVPIMID